MLARKMKLNKYFYATFLPLHVFFIAALFSYSIVNWFLIFCFWVLLSGFGVGVYLHRYLSHKSFKMNKWIDRILLFISCATAQGSPIFWVNMHRGYHHRFSDTDKDPHSPVKGYFYSYCGWMNTIDYKALNYKYVTDLGRDKWHRFVNNYYFEIVPAIWIISLLISPTIFYSLVIAQIIAMHQEFCVNLFCHIRTMPFSYRNFDTKDNSVNYWLPGILLWGVGFHNNHHGKPSSYDFGCKKGEIDFTKYLVRLIKLK